MFRNGSPYNLYLIFILIGGFLVRLWGIDFGLPYLYHQDEGMTMNVTLGFGTGDLHPHYFWHPHLIHYSLFFIYGCYFLLGKGLGWFASLSDFERLFFTNPSSFYLIGRFVMGVLFGTATIWATYTLARKVFSRRVALLSAFFMALPFLHVRNSHYMRHDVPVTFFITCCVAAYLGMVSGGRRAAYLGSGFLTGLAISANWNALLLVPLYGVAHLLRVFDRSQPERMSFWHPLLFGGLLMMGLGLFMTSPFVFLDFPSVFKEFGLLVNRALGPGSSAGWSFNLAYAKEILPIGVGWAFLIAACLGLVFVLGHPEKKAIFLILFPLIYYLVFENLESKLPPYVMPLTPFLCILAAVAVEACCSRLTLPQFWKTVLTGSLAGALIFPSAASDIYHNYLLSQKDTRTSAKEWIETHIPPHSVIALERYLAIQAWVPPLAETSGQNEAILKELKLQNPLKGKTREALQRFQIAGPRYELIDISDRESYFPKYENHYDFDALRARGVDYVVLSSFWRDRVTNSPKISRFYQKLDEKAELVKVFHPFRNEKETVAVLYGVHGPFEGLYRFNRPGPTIKIYALHPSAKRGRR